MYMIYFINSVYCFWLFVYDSENVNGLRTFFVNRICIVLFNSVVTRIYIKKHNFPIRLYKIRIQLSIFQFGYIKQRIQLDVFQFGYFRPDLIWASTPVFPIRLYKKPNSIVNFPIRLYKTTNSIGYFPIRRFDRIGKVFSNSVSFMRC